MYFSQAIIAVIKEISDSGTYKYYNNIQSDQMVFQNFLPVSRFWVYILFKIKFKVNNCEVL